MRAISNVSQFLYLMSHPISHQVIQVEVKQFEIRCIVAYGPQEKDKVEGKLIFWARLAQKIEEAHENDFAIIF